MKQFHKNPRQITTKQYSDLETWLKKYGDLSGVVHDLNSDQVIGGNQRSRIFNINECKIVMLEEYPQPDEQGTVGWGFIIWQGKKYSYRQVRWTEEVCDQANIIANKAGGTFDFDVLANQFDLAMVLASGFEKYELGLYAPLPTLDELAEKYKEPEPEDFWPVIRVKVDPSTMERFQSVMSLLPGETETAKFICLLDRIDGN